MRKLHLLLPSLLLVGCSENQMPALVVDEPCLNAVPTANGLNHSCVAGYKFNKRDLGLLNMNFSWTRGSRGCDEMSGTAGMDQMPGNIRIAISEETGRVEMSSPIGGLVLIPSSDAPDSVYLRSQDSAHPGELVTKLISCPNLTSTVKKLMEDGGESSSNCGSTDPMGKRQEVTLKCDELDKYTETLPFYRNSFSPTNVYQVGVAQLTSRNLRGLVSRSDSPKRGQVIAIVTVLMTIVQIAMQAQKFSTTYDSGTTTLPSGTSNPGTYSLDFSGTMIASKPEATLDESNSR